MLHDGNPLSRVVVASALNRMQAARVFTGPSIRVFTDMAEASAWLDEAGG